MAASKTNDLDPGAALRAALPEQKLFGRYTLRRVLGRGGMGVVWLAHDDELIRNVAMKFLPDMIVRDREAVEDLKRETRRSLDLTHHHIVRIYDFTQDDQCAAIIMEYVDGESLSAMKTRQEGGCFCVSNIQSWVSHFCQAMDYAHRQARVVHRDLKPANLMVNGRGDLKVTDFGISRSMSDSMTRVSMSNSAGTLAYMSPEQALGSPPAIGDDIYALGATLYDMLTGRPPFFRGNLQVQLETVVPPPMETRRAELGNSGEPIPALWEEVIAACLAKRPQDRPQGMMEIASLLGVGSSTTVGYRPSSHRSNAGSHAPGTSPTAAATGTQRTTAPDEAPKTSTAPAPASSRTPSGMIPLRPTRAEDVLFDYTPRPSARPAAPAPTARTTPIVPPAEPVPPVAPPAIESPATAAPPEEPEPLAEVAAESLTVMRPVEQSPASPEPEPAPVAAEAPPQIEAEPVPTAVEIPTPATAEVLPDVEAGTPPQVTPDSATLELDAVIAPMEIPLVPPTDKPQVEDEVAPPPILPAVESPAPSDPEPTMPRTVAPPPPSISPEVNLGHMIGSGVKARSSNRTGLVLAGAGLVVVVSLLGLLAGHSPPRPHPRKAELARHVEAANAALGKGELKAAESEIAAVQSIDPKNAALAALRSSFEQKQREKAESDRRNEELAQQQQQFDAAIGKVNAALSQRDAIAARQDLGAAKQLRPDDPEISTLSNSIAGLEKEIAEDKARVAEAARQQQLQQQFDAAIGKVNDAITDRDPAAARQYLGAAQKIKASDPEIPRLSARIAALDGEMNPKIVDTPADDTPDKTDDPSGRKNRKPQEKKPVAEVKPRLKPEPDRPVVQHPPPSVTRPANTTRPSNPPRPSSPFGPGGAPGG